MIDRYGHRAVLAASMSAGVLGVGLTLVPVLWVVCAGLAVCCTGVFASQTSGSGFVGIAAENHRALAVGLYATFYYLGGAAGAVLPGYFWNWAGWPACAAFIVSVQVITVVLALKFWVLPSRPVITTEPPFIAAAEVD